MKIAAPFAALGLAWAVLADAPLPDPQLLKQRAIASVQQQAKDREKYSCTVRSEESEYATDGSLKKKRVTVADRFYVNGWGVDHVLERDGKALAGDAAKKEQERTDKEVKKYSNAKHAAKEQEETARQLGVFLRAQRLSNGHREQLDGRSIVVFDLAGDPGFHPRNIEERVIQALAGRIWLDEELGVMREVNLHTDRDLKFGVGLVNLRQGFQLHVVQERQADGVWLEKLAEGNGDARAFFSRSHFRFREETSHCRLFSVETEQSVKPPSQ